MKNTQLRFQTRNHLVDEYGFYCEEYFDEMLYIERKRSERSKRCFLVALLDFGEILPFFRSNAILKNISSAFFSITREVDIKGWHKKDSVVGIIFTELDGGNIHLAVESIANKIKRELQKIFPAEMGEKIKISFHSFPERTDTNGSHNSFNSTFYPDIKAKEKNKGKSLYMKRVVDIAGSLLGLVFFSFLLIFISLIIKASSKGPILFKQERIGQFGEKFVFLKFRTMYVNNDESIHKNYVEKLIEGKTVNNGNGSGKGNGTYKMQEDPRITPLGKILRKLSLDEFPQLFNVLRGDMALVGPRPPLPYEIEKYDLWHRTRILEMKPGITGLWQVKGRSSTTFDEMVRLDIRYIQNWSLYLDLKILLMTPWAALSGKGAY